MTAVRRDRAGRHSVQHRAATEQAAGPQAPPGADGAQPTTKQLTALLADQLSRLLRCELRLAVLEARQRARAMSKGAAAFGVAGVLGMFGAACAVVAAIIALSYVLRPWFAALVVGAALFAVAGLVVLPGWRGLTAGAPRVPGDTIDRLRTDLRTVRGAARR